MTTPTKKTKAPAAPKTITCAVSVHEGRPTLTVSFPMETSQRAMRAELFTLAAKIELASETEQWIVHVDANCGWPYISMSIEIELSTGMLREHNAALAVLTKIAGGK